MKKLTLTVIALTCIFTCPNARAQSGASLRTTLRQQAVDECECLALVLTGEVAPYYSYKVQSTTSINAGQWIDEFTPVTALSTNMSWAMPIATTGNKFFRIVELGLGGYVGIITDPSSPVGRTLHISSTNVTANVPLAVYQLKSRRVDSVLGDVMVEMISTMTNTQLESTLCLDKTTTTKSAYSMPCCNFETIESPRSICHSSSHTL